MKCVAFFDFDGTVTSKDSMIDFIRFTFGRKRLYLGLLSVSVYLVAYKLKLYSGKKAKEKLLSHFFYKQKEDDLYRLGNRYGLLRINKILRDKAVEKIKWHKSKKHDVFIVSASVNIWLAYWCKQQEIGLICSKLDYNGGLFSGKLLGKNCNGIEKVDRIMKMINLKEYDLIYSYGDTKGDKPMLNIANFSFYKTFK